MFIVFILLGGFLLLVPRLYRKKNTNIPTKEIKKNPSFAILIPARNESKVISGLLESIQSQTERISMQDVYVIVESENDPTVLITEKFGSKIIVRKHLELKRKGYALNEAVEEILSCGKNYDAYFIFDADNILSPTYLEEMKRTYLEGYDIGIGYRNSKNGNVNMITACSTLTFSMINTLGNEAKNINHENVVVSGTGFYIKGKWIEKWKGYPFHSLTEDYELYLYSILNEMTSFYNKKAIFYDEQPLTLKQTIVQRTRWIKGFFSARKIYIPKIRKSIFKKSKNKGSRVLESIGIMPYLCMVIGALGLIFLNLGRGIYHQVFENSNFFFYYFIALFLLLLVYLILVIFTGYLISREKYLNLNKKTKWKSLFYNPIFLASYIICLVKSITHKEIEWVPIEHTENVIQ